MICRACALVLGSIGLALPPACTGSSREGLGPDGGPATQLSELDVTAFGAVPNDDRDDSRAIQRAVDAARDGDVKIVTFPEGTYLVHREVQLPAGIALLGRGATLRRPAGMGEFHRLFSTAGAGYTYRGDVDSPPLEIRGFRFDGQSAAQGAFRDFEKEHQSCIFLVGDRSRPGRLVAVVEDVEFVNNAADGVTVHTNVDATVRRVRAWDVFRGAVTITGGHSVIRMEDIEAGGDEFPTGINVEADARGFGDTRTVAITARNLRLKGRLYVGLADSATFTGTDITSGPPYKLVARDDAVIDIRSSRFAIGAPLPVQYARDVRFTDVTFRLTDPGPAVSRDTPLTALRIVWRSQYEPDMRDQKLECLRCRFLVDSGLRWPGGAMAIETGADQAALANRLVVRDSYFGAGFAVAMNMEFGGTWEVRGTEVLADTAAVLRYRDTAQYPRHFYDVLFERLPGATAPIAERGPPHAGNRLTIPP
ncbi:MAG TPA: glycosyl hydrolase family 28-related protein [Gemmatimonadaceae bacterium]|nr:glycosyl hydrolase family 28-related protein [Gemmatimonadaceae bacterium]